MVVYPRWRGELDRTASVVSSGSGLSPLARGTPVFANLWTIAIRFIPAGAGNTGARNTKPCICSVYPRWRGEHEMLVSVNAANTGLSPLARGTHYAFLRLPGFCRFIPAGAGNTHMIRRARRWHSVYPRWRGEHRITPRFLPRQRGLSPLARGTLHEPKFQGWDSRFIPAGAGNTYILKRLLNHKTVYPRWRGEHLKRRASASRLLGLSPLARGTRFCLRYLLLCLRFIPAGAGNTVCAPAP